MPIPKSTGRRTVYSPALKALTVPIVSISRAEVTWEAAIRGGVHPALVVNCALERVRGHLKRLLWVQKILQIYDLFVAGSLSIQPCS